MNVQHNAPIDFSPGRLHGYRIRSGVSEKRKVSSALIIIIGIQPLGRSGQRPEFSQATGMALVRCILGKFS